MNRLLTLTVLALTGSSLALAFDPTAAIGKKFLLQNNLSASIKGAGSKQSLCAPLELTIDSATTCHVDMLAVDAQGGYYYPGTPVIASIPCSFTALDANKVQVNLDDAGLTDALGALTAKLRAGAGTTVDSLTVTNDTTLVWPRADMLRSPFWMRASATLATTTPKGPKQKLATFVLGKKVKKLPAEGTPFDWSTPKYLTCPAGSGYSDDGGYGTGY
ncbi:MAG: hypothetical protein U0V87_10790 [Acidobacteriota bacterium]